MHPQRLKLVILGRAGVLNIYRDDHVTAPDEWQPVPGTLEAVARLNQAGWHTVVATNQSGISPCLQHERFRLNAHSSSFKWQMR